MSIVAGNLANAYERQYGSPYPKDTDNPAIPHNILRFFKKLPKKLIPKLLALTKLDVVLREILLSTISLDGPGRDKLVHELGILSHKLEEPMDKLVKSFGNSMKSVLQAIPGLNIVYAISDLSEAVKDGNDAVGDTAGTLSEFIDKVDHVYKRSAGSNRLMSSMMYALMDYLDENGDARLIKHANKHVGKRMLGSPDDTPIDPDVTVAAMNRSFTPEVAQKGLTGLLSEASRSEHLDDGAKKLALKLSEAITKEHPEVEAGTQQEVRGFKGIGLLDSMYEELQKMAEE